MISYFRLFCVCNCNACNHSDQLNINVGDNVTLKCNASPITKNASLHWVVDGDEYNITGIFSSSRGQLMVEEPVLDTVSCMISSSLTIFDVQLNSQGVYTCILQDTIYTLTRNRSLTLNTESSTEGTNTYVSMLLSAHHDLSHV